MIDWENLTVGQALKLIDDRIVHWQENKEEDTFSATYTNEDDLPCIGTFSRSQVTALA